MMALLVLLSVALLAAMAIIVVLIMIIQYQSEEILDRRNPVKSDDAWHDSDFIMYGGRNGKK